MKIDKHTVDEHMVTVRVFALFVRETGYEYPNGLLEPQLVRPSSPVRWVSYEDAQAYCRWVDARLPTDAEWEAGIASTAHSGLWEWVEEMGVLRGGSWYTDHDNAACAYRYNWPPALRNFNIGFRCARDE